MSYRKENIMWRERIIEAKTTQGISTKTMAERMNTTEKTVKRLLDEKSKSPYITTVLDAGASVGLSPQELFAESGLYVGTETLAEMQEELKVVTEELKLYQVDCSILEERIDTLTAENDKLRKELEHKEELLALHDYYSILIKKLNNKKVLRKRSH